MTVTFILIFIHIYSFRLDEMENQMYLYTHSTEGTIYVTVNSINEQSGRNIIRIRGNSVLGEITFNIVCETVPCVAIGDELRLLTTGMIFDTYPAQVEVLEWTKVSDGQ